VAWKNVKPSKNLPVTVALGARQGWGVAPGYPVLVASGDREAALIRSLTAEALQLESSPDLVSSRVASLSRVPNPGLAGYVFAFLTHSQTFSKVTQPGLAADLFSPLFGSPSVPAELWAGMPF